MANGVTVRNDGTVEVSGELTFQTVPEFLARGALAAPGMKTDVTVDLGGITLADSAGIALLLEWHHQARVAGRALRFVNLPEQLRRLIGVSGLTHILDTP